MILLICSCLKLFLVLYMVVKRLVVKNVPLISGWVYWLRRGRTARINNNK